MAMYIYMYHGEDTRAIWTLFQSQVDTCLEPQIFRKLAWKLHHVKESDLRGLEPTAIKVIKDFVK